MLRQTNRVVLGAFLALVAFAGSAAAECAWVWWGTTYHYNANGQLTSEEWIVLGAYESRAECDANRLRWVASTKESRQQRVPLCLPDTVDPRGPKGGGR